MLVPKNDIFGKGIRVDGAAYHPGGGGRGLGCFNSYIKERFKIHFVN